MQHAPDSSYSWFRMAVSLALATIGGIGLWAAVITLPVIQQEFGIDRSGASFPYTMTMIGFALGGLLMGRLADRFGIMVPMFIGTLLLGVGFLFMLGASMERGGDIADPTIKAGLSWLLLTYFFHTVGELCLSPIGLSMITKLAPVKFASMLMGVWFLSPFVAQIIGGYIAAYVEKLGAFTVFGLIAAFVVAAGLIMFAISRKLVTMMHGRG